MNASVIWSYCINLGGVVFLVSGIKSLCAKMVLASIFLELKHWVCMPMIHCVIQCTPCIIAVEKDIAWYSEVDTNDRWSWNRIFVLLTHQCIHTNGGGWTSWSMLYSNIDPTVNPVMKIISQPISGHRKSPKIRYYLCRKIPLTILPSSTVFRKKEWIKNDTPDKKTVVTMFCTKCHHKNDA